MGKYLWEVNYTAAGSAGVLKEGGTSRIEMVEKMLSNLGGKLENAYFSFGDTDVVLIADIPDNATAAAISMAVSSAGAASVRTRVLLKPEEIDAASKKIVEYRVPGK